MISQWWVSRSRSAAVILASPKTAGHSAIHRLGAPIDDVADEFELDEVIGTEKQLLYVAVTRARERLLISGVSPESEFLEELSQDNGLLWRDRSNPTHCLGIPAERRSRKRRANSYPRSNLHFLRRDRELMPGHISLDRKRSCRKTSIRSFGPSRHPRAQAERCLDSRSGRTLCSFDADHGIFSARDRAAPVSVIMELVHYLP